jgi:hypothetical protein
MVFLFAGFTQSHAQTLTINVVDNSGAPVSGFGDRQPVGEHSQKLRASPYIRVFGNEYKRANFS